MDKTKKFISDETGSPDQRASTVDEAENLDALSRVLDVLKVSPLSSSDLATKSKKPHKEGKESPDKRDKDMSAYKRTIQGSSEARTSRQFDTFKEDPVSSFTTKLQSTSKEMKKKPHIFREQKEDKTQQEGIEDTTSQSNSDEEEAKEFGQQDLDKFDYSSIRKTNVRNKVFKFIRKAIANPSGAIKNLKFVGKKNKMPRVFESKPIEMSIEKGRYSLRMDEFSEISNEKCTSLAKSDGFKDLKSNITSLRKENTKAEVPENSEMEYETAPETKDAYKPLSSTLSVFVPKSQIDSLKCSLSSEIRTDKEVLEHFRLFMRSKSREESSDTNKFNISTGDTKPSESVIRSLEEPSISTSHHLGDLPAAKSTSKDLTFSKPEMESANIRKSTKRINEVSVTQIDNSSTEIKTSRKKQRIVYDESMEYFRNWILEKVKDKEILMKFKIMEGTYSNDLETKMRCIEEAQNLQEETDAYFDILDEYQKMSDIPEDFGYSYSPRNSPNSSRKHRNVSKWEQQQIRSFSQLFHRIYKSTGTQTSNENIFERIHPTRFNAAFNEYRVSRQRHDRESDKIEHTAISAVEDLYFAAAHCRSKVKCKIPYPQTESLEDYQNYIRVLRMAVSDNLNCLNSLFSRVTSVILPLFSYLSRSRKTVMQIFAFLDQERNDIFLETSISKAFFEEFCKRHFKE